MLRLRGRATRSRTSALHLIAIALIVVGLAVSAPPSCVCQPGDHFGALLHPIFAHVHGSDHSPFQNDADYQLASHDPATYDSAPGLSAPTNASVGHESLGGMLLPVLLAMLLAQRGRRPSLAMQAPTGRVVSPPIPPPRPVFACL
ncbi:MAG: hypothetical protein AB7K36_19560 [Chloroflexota bacterium]